MLLIPLLSMHLHFTLIIDRTYIYSWIYVFNVAHQANSKQLGCFAIKNIIYQFVKPVFEQQSCLFTVILRLTVILPDSAHTVLFYSVGLKILTFDLNMQISCCRGALIVCFLI